MALGLGWVQKSPCLDTYRSAGGALALDWRGGRQFADMCYSDVVALYGAERLDQPGMFPYETSWVEGAGTPARHVRYMEYPVLTGVFMWATAQLARGYGALVAPSRPNVVAYAELVALLLAGAWLVVVAGVMRMTRRRPWDALLVAVSPLVIAHGFTNFDALAVALATAGMLAWARGRPRLAGVLLGLGGAAKLYPLVLLVALVALCWRAGKLGDGLRATGAAIVSWVVVNAPVVALLPAGWSEFFRFNATRGAGFESLYAIGSYFTGWGGFDGGLPPGRPPSVLNAASAGIFAAACLAVAYVALSAPRRPRVAQLCLLVVAAFLLSNKVYSPQYSLWLVPLAVLALPRWRLLLAWMTIDALVWVPTMLFQLDPGHGALAEGYFLAAVMIRDLAVAALCAVVLRDVYRPARDIVRRGGEDDPCGGPLDGAGDRVLLRRPGPRCARPAGA